MLTLSLKIPPYMEVPEKGVKSLIYNKMITFLSKIPFRNFILAFERFSFVKIHFLKNIHFNK